MMAKFLQTNDIAQALGIHVNTVRNYEAWGYLPTIPRGENGYRRYTPLHLEQARLAYLVLQWPYLGERAALVTLVQSAAQNDLGAALEKAYEYLARIRTARATAEVALEFLEHWAAGHVMDTSPHKLIISQAAQHLNITVDTLRNWERNGLIHIPRNSANHYRQYGAAEFARLRVIRLLIHSGFGLMAITRMLQRVDAGQTDNLRAALELPLTESANEAIEVLSDRWFSNLDELEQRAQSIIEQIGRLLTLVQSRES